MIAEYIGGNRKSALAKQFELVKLEIERGGGRGLKALDEAVHRQQTRALGFDAARRPCIGRLEAYVADA